MTKIDKGLVKICEKILLLDKYRDCVNDELLEELALAIHSAGYRKILDEKSLEDVLIKSIDHIGLELRVWKESYFGRKPEEKLVKELAHKLKEEMEKLCPPVRGILVEFAQKQFPEHIIHLVKRDDINQTLFDLRQIIEKKKKKIDIDIDLTTSASKDWQDYYEIQGWNQAIDTILKEFK